MDAATVPRLRVVVGASIRLRDEAIERLLTNWTGPIERRMEPEVAPLLADADTPPIFGECALLVVRCSQEWIGRAQDRLAAQVALPCTASPLVLVTPGLDGRWALTKALTKAGVRIDAEPPGPKEMLGWLVDRLESHTQGCRQSAEVARLLMAGLGDDADTLLGGIDVLAVHQDDQPIEPSAVVALFPHAAQRPIWEFTEALLAGDVRKALNQLHAIPEDARSRAEQMTAAIGAELRRLLACCESADDQEVQRWIPGKASLFHARRRARQVGRPALLRLMNGLVQLQRSLRQSGHDPDVLMERFVCHAQRVVQPAGRL
jgi:DNA polymerase III delta subunit